MIYAANSAKAAVPSGGSSGGYGSAEDWSKILAAIGEGAGAGMQSATANANSKAEAKAAKRRTLANLLNSALKRNQGLFRIGQEHGDEMSDFQSQAMNSTARGFVDALNGTTR